MFLQEKRDFERNLEPKDNIKEAFAKVKTDIFTIGKEVQDLKSQIFEIKSILSNLNNVIDKLNLEIFELNLKKESITTDIPTDNVEKPTNIVNQTDIPTVPQEIKGLKYQNLDISTGNKGVPTDKQTYKQTDNNSQFFDDKLSLANYSEERSPPNLIPNKSITQHIDDASMILDSLDNLKKEIRLKFKQITNQEMLVFTTIYQLNEQFPEGVEYRQIASLLKLSESSIRDYTQKLISKGIPVDKVKLNNKKILLKISSKLKSIAPLQTLIKLREI